MLLGQESTAKVVVKHTAILSKESAKTFFFFKKSNPTKKCNYEMFFGFTKLGPRVFGAKAKDTAISLGEI